MFKRTKVCKGVLLALGGALIESTASAQTEPPPQTIEVTGSRIKRADSEGSLPVTVFKREDLEASGATTIAEFVRGISFATSGNFRPQSGGSAQSFSEVSLRGLGSARTLVLVDGRRVAKAPNVGDAADMSSIPMAAVERIEILTDGASATYGSDAIGGVVNVILRKDFEGLHVAVGRTKPSIKGGDRSESSAVMGVTSDKGRFVAGVSKTSRDIIFVRDYPWGAERGISSFSNGFYAAVDDGDGGLLAQINNGGFRGNAGACDFADKGFYVARSPATPEAPEDWRSRQIAQREGIGEKKARERIRVIEHEREYLRKIYEAKFGQKPAFNITYDCSRFSLVQIAQQVVLAMKLKGAV